MNYKMHLIIFLINIKGCIRILQSKVDSISKDFDVLQKKKKGCIVNNEHWF
jgi:hypothetical protein